jgi:hypothetical protein
LLAIGKGLANKNLFYLIPVILLFILASCAAVPAALAAAPPPLWRQNPQAVYPDSKYIAQSGQGPTKSAAENAALAAISRYFTSEVEAVSGYRQTESTVNGRTTSIGYAEDSAFVRSQTELIAVRYTESWYNRAEKTYECMAYIDRAEAWKIYEPILRQGVEAFISLYHAAETESEPFRQISLYSAAHREALKSLPEVSPKLTFARVLNPKAAEQFDAVFTNAASVPQKILSAKSRSTIFIRCNSDVDGIVYSVISKALSAEGLSVTTNKNTAAVLCEVNISENKQTLPAGTFYTPSVNIVINGKTQSLYSFSASVDERIGANNPDVARQRAYTALANRLGETFKVDIE